MAEKKETKWRYRLQLLSERHNRVVFTFSMPVWLTVIMGVLLTFATAFFALYIVTATPLRAYLPGYLDMNKRTIVVESAMRIDSIAHESNLRSLYLENLMTILSDRNVSHENITQYDSAVVRFNDSIIPVSEREQAFIAKYENQERFGLNALASNNKLSAVSFVDVAKGKVLVPEESDSEGLFIGTKLELARELPILSPLEATVIAERYIVGSGYEVTLQCANDYVVILSHLSSIMVDEGKQLKAGAVVGHAGSQKDSSNSWILIHIWHKGKPVDPQSAMNF